MSLSNPGLETECSFYLPHRSTDSNTFYLNPSALQFQQLTLIDAGFSRLVEKLWEYYISSSVSALLHSSSSEHQGPCMT